VSSAPNTAAPLDVRAAVDTARGLSRYARQLLDRPGAAPDADALAEPYGAERMRAELEAQSPQDEMGLKRALRQLRQRVMLHVMLRDLGGAAALEEVTSTMTALAETTLRFALERLDRWLTGQYGEPRSAGGRRQTLTVVGMGKLGGGELNVSSDIDLVFVYPDAGETTGPRTLSSHEYFTRLARKLIAALNEITEDGFVFRVDMRLRPYGDSGPLVVSLDMLEEYFTTQGRAWERYAWVKGRSLTGDADAELMAIVTPFVYRRHLDFSAIQSMRELHAQIRSEVRRRDRADDVKLGPGGIREIEFIAQVFQLIRGGQDSSLRVRPTVAALRALRERRLLPEETVQRLSDAYRFLRTLEHRIQYLDDQQTQRLPTATDDQERVAHGMGFADYASLLARLTAHRETVTGAFEALFAESRTQGESDDLGALATAAPGNATIGAALTRLGYDDPDALLGRIQALRGSARFRRMSAAVQARFDRLLPQLARAAARYGPATTTLGRMLQIMESIGRRESYLALLEEYPQTLDAVAKLVSLSPWATDYLGQHPMLLDELIDPRQLVEPDWPAAARRLDEELAQARGNVERQMDLLRQFKHGQTFRLLALDLAGSLTLERLSDHLSDLATLLVQRVVDLAWQNLRTRHRDAPRFALIGYGKFGGKELGYASDLDIIFLYDDDAPEAAEVYARLAQRISTWLTSYTGAGVLYEVDLRLRPDGAAGLLVSRVGAFEAYQRNQAWTWEHQALTRARFEAGDPAIGARFERLRVEILRLPRDPEKLRRDVIEMRGRMRDGHPNASGLFDVKHDPGGIVDVEFIVQYLVLAHARAHEPLTGNLGNIALLRMAGQLGLVDRELAAQCADAYRSYRRVQHELRLRGDTFARVPQDRLVEERTAVRALWRAVLGD
jgi:glutamate-ammonia-ligase adenylyltransferase